MTRVARYMRAALAAAVALSSAHPGVHAADAVRTLEPGMPIGGEISGRAVQSFQITLKDGQDASAVVDHRGIALVVRLVDAAGVVQIEKEIRGNQRARRARIRQRESRGLPDPRRDPVSEGRGGHVSDRDRRAPARERPGSTLVLRPAGVMRNP